VTAANKQSRTARAQPPAPLRPGLSASFTKVVPLEWTLAHYCAKLPPVFSTPAMIGLMESAAAKAIQPALPPGSISVGTRIEVDHLKAVAVGARVRFRAKLLEASGRFLKFSAEARSGGQVIGRGFVYRAIVPVRGFTLRASRRK
jgi:fluoroacetyl-CoA thioesterase